MKLAAKGTVTETPADQGDWQAPDEVVGPNFILKHPLDAKEREIHAKHLARVAYVRLEYQRRLNELNRWYDHQKLEAFDGLVQELEAINR